MSYGMNISETTHIAKKHLTVQEEGSCRIISEKVELKKIRKERVGIRPSSCMEFPQKVGYRRAPTTPTPPPFSLAFVLTVHPLKRLMKIVYKGFISAIEIYCLKYFANLKNHPSQMNKLL